MANKKGKPENVRVAVSLPADCYNFIKSESHSEMRSVDAYLRKMIVEEVNAMKFRREATV